MTGESSGSNGHNASERVILQIGGLPRSGTTALSDIVNECPEVAVMAEYRLADLVAHLRPILGYQAYVEDVNRSVASQTSGVATIPYIWDKTGVANGDSPTKWYSPFSSPDLDNTLRYPTIERLPDIVTSVVQASLDKPGARVIGSKTPGHMLTDVDGDIQRMYSDVRYVAMLRSPLDQINSSINRRNGKELGKDAWHLDTVDEAINQYLEIICGLIILQYKVGEALLFVKFEDLINQPSFVLASLFAHIDIMWRPDRHLTYAERGTLDVLTSDELNQVSLRLGNVIEGWEKAILTGKNNIGLGIFHSVLPKVPENRVIVGVGYPSPFLISGWSGREEFGAWTDSASATMLFAPATDTAPRLLNVEVLPFLAAGVPLGIEVLVNGASVDEKLFCPGAPVMGLNNDRVLAIPHPGEIITIGLGPIILRSDDMNIIEFKLTGIVSPASIGLGTDLRTLGLQLSALQFVPLDKGHNDW